MAGATNAIVLLLAALVALSAAQSSVWTGSYTGARYGGLTHFCVDPRTNQLQGSYSEAGLLQGEVNSTHAWGRFYEAGTPDPDRELNCNTGFFMVQPNNNGFFGSWKCEGEDYYDDDEGLLFHGFHSNANRPSDEECCLLDHSNSDVNVAGEWANADGSYTFVACTDDDDWQASYIRPDETATYGEGRTGYVDGFETFLDRKVCIGTWYENFKGGAMLAFVRESGDLGIFQWSGLKGKEGATVIDPFDYADDTDHFVFNLEHLTQDESNCDQYRGLESFVLGHLPDDDTDASYFFVGDDLFDDDYDTYFYETHLTPVNETLLEILRNAPPPPSAASVLNAASGLLLAGTFAFVAFL